MKYYIGIDGGGTKTQYTLFDENKNMVSEVRTGGSNHEKLAGSYDEAAETLYSGVTSLLETAGMTQEDVEAILIGLAGMDQPFQITLMQEKLQALGLLCKTYIFNDGYIVTKAAAPGGMGIGYNCGTGTCCNSIGIDGKMLQLGGFLEYSGDKGNGHWLATQTWNMIYDEICLRRHTTLMTSLFLEKTKISKDAEDFQATASLFTGEEPDAFIRQLIVIYFEALNAGDLAALEICEEMSERGAQFIAAHFQFQNFGEGSVPVVLSGSLHTKLPSEVYLRMLEEKAVKMTGRDLNFLRLDCQPVMGCINWLLDGTLAS